MMEAIYSTTLTPPMGATSLMSFGGRRNSEMNNALLKSLLTTENPFNSTDIGGRVFSGTSSGVLNFSAYMGAAAQSFVYGSLLNHIGWTSVFASLAILCATIVVLGFTGSNRKPSA